MAPAVEPWHSCSETTMGRRMAVPVRAVFSRLQQAADEPSWAAYLPKELRRGALGGDKKPAIAPASPASPPRVTPAAAGAANLEAILASLTEPPMQLSPGAVAVSGPVAGQVWLLSRQQSGCREVQRALEASATYEERAALAEELRGHVWEALRCPHANYVLQKCIVTLRPQSLQFIIDELLMKGTGAMPQVARHRYGCRILERLLETCLPQQVDGLVTDLLSDAVALSQHPFGNYVVQHLLEYGARGHRQALVRMLGQHVATLGTDVYASAVLGKALVHGARQDQASLAEQILQAPGLLAEMVRGRPGSLTAKLVVQALDNPPDRDAAQRIIAAESASLRASRACRNAEAPVLAVSSGVGCA